MCDGVVCGGVIAGGTDTDEAGGDGECADGGDTRDSERLQPGASPCMCYDNAHADGDGGDDGGGSAVPPNTRVTNVANGGAREVAIIVAPGNR